MFSSKAIIVKFFFAFFMVLALSNFALAAVSQCLIDCSDKASKSAGCAGFTDVSCNCKSNEFKKDALKCGKENCSSADYETGVQLLHATCPVSS
jgi:hypothetical protein